MKDSKPAKGQKVWGQGRVSKVGTNWFVLNGEQGKKVEITFRRNGDIEGVQEGRDVKVSWANGPGPFLFSLTGQ
jgi:hypothetical protein